MGRREFAIAAVYDTETTTIGETPQDIHAFPILFIDNDIRDVDLRNYVQDVNDNIHLFRYEDEYLSRIDEYVKWGKVCNKVPIICAYNLMFDLQPIMESLNERYDIQVNAQTSTNVYTLDLLEKDGEYPILRFWDMFHLDMRGLAKMGEVAGLPKATGDWDYSLIRTPETPLTDDERFYARRDTQVLPMYLRFLLRTNEWMRQGDLGSKVLTKTSLVRQMAKSDIGTLKVLRDNGKEMTLYKMYLELCKQEKAKNFNQYALRKACFRGGFTFTSARWSCVPQSNVVSVDVTSMHHTFLNGRFIPTNFKHMTNADLLTMCENVLTTSKSYVYENYHNPFRFAFHVRVKLTNIRLLKGSAFEQLGIGLAPMSKFKSSRDLNEDMAKYLNEQSIIDAGFHDFYDNATFAFGKLYKADSVTMHLTELELWSMGRVYEWDSLEVIYGEGTMRFVRPPDYVTLQSNMLYKLKDDNKFITEHYKEGEPYPFNIPKGIPSNYAESLRNGTLPHSEFEAYYISDTKGKFNGIYGTMAQDELKAQYVCTEGDIHVDLKSIVTRENFDELNKGTSKVLYTYGMRIVGGSRMHMVLAIEELYERLGDRAHILGGDTDSMKVSVNDDVSDSDIASALGVFDTCSKLAIDKTMERVRRAFPTIASSLRGIGGFTIENEGNHYAKHLELWNKCRVSIDIKEHVHITCAGLSRPRDEYHIERFMEDLLRAGYDADVVLGMCVGFNVFVGSKVAHALEGRRPDVKTVYRGTIRDYQGKESVVTAHESIALYPIGRWLGETMKAQNRLTVSYLENTYGRYPDTRNRYLFFDDGIAQVCTDGLGGYETLMATVTDWRKDG